MNTDGKFPHSDKVPIRTQVAMIENKLVQWNQNYFNALVDAKVAQDIDDEKMEESAVEIMKRSTKAINGLESFLEELKELAKDEPEPTPFEQ